MHEVDLNFFVFLESWAVLLQHMEGFFNFFIFFLIVLVQQELLNKQSW